MRLIVKSIPKPFHLLLLSLFLNYSNYVNAQTSRCAELTICYRGGQNGDPCVISSRRCAPCIAHYQDCFEYGPGGTCPFENMIDCGEVFLVGGGSVNKTSTPTPTPTEEETTTKPPTTKKPTPSPTTRISTLPPTTTKPPETTTTKPTTSTNENTSNNSGSDAKFADTENSKSKESNGSSGIIVMIFGIALVVLGITMLFITLVRRSTNIEEESEEEEEELSTHPYAASKANSEESGNKYASTYYGRASLASTTTSQHNGMRGSYAGSQHNGLPPRSVGVQEYNNANPAVLYMQPDYSDEYGRQYYMVQGPVGIHNLRGPSPLPPNELRNSLLQNDIRFPPPSSHISSAYHGSLHNSQGSRSNGSRSGSDASLHSSGSKRPRRLSNQGRTNGDTTSDDIIRPTHPLATNIQTSTECEF